MAKCFHVFFRKGNPYLSKRIPFVSAFERGGDLRRNPSLEDHISSMSPEIRQLIDNPDGFHVKDGRHYGEKGSKEWNLSLDNISLEPVGGWQAEKYKLDVCKQQSNQAYVMLCPNDSSGYQGRRVFILNPGEEKEVEVLGNTIKIAHKDGKIFLNGGQGIDVHYDHTWPSKMKVFA